MNAIESLKAVLCGPDGKCCIHGSQADRDAVDLALLSMTTKHKDPRAVIEQLVDALQGAENIILFGVAYDKSAIEAHMTKVRAAITTGREALVKCHIETICLQRTKIHCII